MVWGSHVQVRTGVSLPTTTALHFSLQPPPTHFVTPPPVSHPQLVEGRAEVTQIVNRDACAARKGFVKVCERAVARGAQPREEALWNALA
eukprot:267538-Chlamydomonas_euryale.AAC.1